MLISLGPVGVGKTKLVQELSLELFHSTESIMNINVNEYRRLHLFDRLITIRG